MLALGETFASGAITTVGCTPCAITEGSRNSAAALAKATFVSLVRSRVLPDTEIPSGATTHCAAEAAARSVCFAVSTNIKSPDEARSGEATPLSSIEPLPSTAAPIFRAKSAAVVFIGSSDSVHESQVTNRQSQKVIQRRFAGRPRLPSCVNPNPLPRIPANDVFSHLREALRVFENVALGIAGANQVERRFKTQAVFLQGMVPNSVAGHNGGTGMERYSSHPRGRAGGLAEEINEDAFLRHGVLVRENSDRAGVSQNFQYRSCGFILEDRLVAGEASVAIHQRV